MATSINKLSGTDTLTEDDLLPVWVDLQGDTRKASVGRLKTYLEQNLNILGTGATQLSDLTDVIVPNVTDGQVLSYNEAAKQWFAVTIANGGDTDGVTEGASNLYFTDARARAAVSGTGDIAYNSTTGVFSFSNTSGFITSYTVTQSDVTTHGDPRYLQKTLAQGQVFVGNVSNQAAARALAQSDIANLSTDLAAKLDSSAYTASDVLTKLKTVDGTGSLLDADLLDGQQGTYYLDYNNLTNTPTIPTNNNQLINGAGYITTYTVTQGDVTAHQAALSITESQISDLGSYSAVTSGAGAPSTAPSGLGNIYIDTTNDDAYIAVGTVSAADWEKSNDGTGTGGGGGSVTSVSGIGTVSGISLFGTVTTSGSIALGGTLAADTSNITTGTFADARIAQSNVIQHQAALSITESQVSDLGTYSEVSTGTTAPATTPDAAGDIFVDTTGDNVYVATGTTNSGDWLQVSGSGNLNNLGDVTITAAATGEFLRYNGAAWVDTTISASDVPSLDASKITSGTFANARISSASVTQHEGNLTITESQISDLGTYATTTALNLKADISSPSFTGTPTAPTAGAATNNTQIATTAYVTTAISNLVNAAPSTLDTLNELAAALGDDPNFATTITNSIATKAPIASPTLTGTPAAPTATTGTNTTQIATTAFVQQEIGAIDITLGTETTGNYVATIAGTANEIEVSGSGSETAAVTIGLPDDVSVTGDLTADTIKARAAASANTSVAIDADDANTVVIATGTIEIPSATFTARDVVIITAGSSNRTINRGSGLAMYKDGTDEASVTLAANGMMSVVFETANKCIISGNFA